MTTWSNQQKSVGNGGGNKLLIDDLNFLLIDDLNFLLIDDGGAETQWSNQPKSS